jgi:hypothetical protein
LAKADADAESRMAKADAELDACFHALMEKV